MTASLVDRGVRAVLLDIEGTTTSIAYVYEELFPYARAHLTPFLDDPANLALVDALAQELSAEHAADVARGQHPPAWIDTGVATRRTSIDAYARWLIDRDRKAPGLKHLQGLITDLGYRRGDLHGHVYADVPVALRRWRAQGIDAAIYSSGSELAQRRLFESTRFGDLTPWLVRFFDTAVGAKGDAESYASIARELGHPPGRILFVSDVTRELAAARTAGLPCVLSLRSGNPPQPDAAEFEAVENLSEL